jgi:predicted enzyme related to lactoylglutathione lyase
VKANFFLGPTSENPQRLFEFYRDVVGLPPQEGMGEWALVAGGATIGFASHHDTCGMAAQPSRFLLDFHVADVAAEQRRMEERGARFIRTQGREEWGGVISTFVDPDGNYGQVVQVPGGGGEPGQVTTFLLDITSEDKDRMLAFYRDIVGLEPFPAVGPYGLAVSDGMLLHFDTHSETRGPNPEPSRMLLNFFVDDVVAERERLEAAGLRFFRKEGREFWGGLISSFLDPDGNIVQLIQYRPDLDTTRAQG